MSDRLALIADDEIVFLRAQELLLRSLGYDVITARDGATALDLFKQHRDEIQVVLTDKEMPLAGGSETMRNIHAIDETVPVILVSGSIADQDKQHFVEEGFSAVLRKPYVPSELAQVLESSRRH